MVFAFIFSLGACSETDDLKDLLELELDPPDRKTIDHSRMGVNNFFVNSEFGNIPTQYSTIKNTLRLNHVRVLFAWSNDVQRSAAGSPNFNFYDDVIEAIPAGMDVLIVLAHAPDWMGDPSNWTVNGNPRHTWAEKYLRTVVRRYANNPRVVGYEIWNEPDLPVLPADGVMGFSDPENYMDLVRTAAPIIRSEDPSALVLMAATQSIQQNYSATLDYNRALRNAGIQDLVDVYNIHYYGEQYENVIRDDGVEDFLDSISIPIWVTESGEQEPNEQLAYVETAWPFLREKMPQIDRIYYYEFGSPEALENNYGLQTTDPNFPVSDLYIHLRDR
jgi:hypothetical protein